MAQVTLLKNIGNYKAGDEMEVSEARAKYWRKIGVIGGEKSESKPTKKTITKPTAKREIAPPTKNKKFSGIEKVKK